MRLLLAVVLAGLILFAAGVLARAFAPTSNSDLSHFDVLIVLGSPADRDGNPTSDQLARVTEAVHEYERGVAPRLILSGGAAHNRFVEAEVMARTAESMGVSRSALLIEPQSMNTIQNLRFSLRLMQEHGWHSAEVVSTTPHLPRAGLILSRLPLEWRTHAAPMQPDSALRTAEATLRETLKTVRYLVWTRWSEPYEP
jgi:uncharacterized SAM-binding protein YcdF (DUF218 family)